MIKKPSITQKTFAEWNAEGRRINKGSKAVGFRDGQPLFELHQTYAHDSQRRVMQNLGTTGPWDDPPH